jgi:hypothetical protein
VHSYKYDFRTSFNFFKLFNDFIQDNIFFFFLTIFFIYKSCILSNTCYLYRYILVPLHFTAVWKGKTGVMNIHNLFVVSLLNLNVNCIRQIWWVLGFSGMDFSRNTEFTGVFLYIEWRLCYLLNKWDDTEERCIYMFEVDFFLYECIKCEIFVQYSTSILDVHAGCQNWITILMNLQRKNLLWYFV